MNEAPWATPLRDYIGIAWIREPHPSVEADGPRNLEHVRKAILERPTEWPEFRVPERPDLLFRVHNSRCSGGVAVVDAATGDLMGAHTPFYPYVLPQFRGRNLNAEMNAIIDDRGRRRYTSNYSPAGFRSRIATHRLHVDRALAAGRDVPENVMRDYMREGGRIRLREPWTAEAHIAWSDTKAAAASFDSPKATATLEDEVEPSF